MVSLSQRGWRWWVAVASLASVAIASVALGYLALAAEDEQVEPSTPAQQNVTFTPTARRVALAFIRNVASGNRAGALKLLDPTYPCVGGQPVKAWRGQPPIKPFKWRYRRRDVGFSVGVASANWVLVEPRIHPRRGRGNAFQMVLMRHGRDGWLVGYWDTVIGPTPLQYACEMTHKN